MKTFVYVILILLAGIIIGNKAVKNDLFSFLNNSHSKIEQLNEEAANAWSEMTDLAKKETGAVFDMQYLDAMITMYEGSTKLSDLGETLATSDVKKLAGAISSEDEKRLAELKALREKLQAEIEANSSNKQKPPFVKQ